MFYRLVSDTVVIDYGLVKIKHETTVMDHLVNGLRPKISEPYIRNKGN